MITAKHVSLFRRIFKGRDDVFAIRWERGGKSGYMPAYNFEAELLRIHKESGGTFHNFPQKQFQCLTDNEIKAHLEGKKHIGMYPLLKDHTSWFIVADFDGNKARDEASRVFVILEDYSLPVYMERSRSGAGIHLWMFFESPYPASRSRSLLLRVLQQAGVISEFDKNSGFDRLFPSQDRLTGKLLGNLIALPLQGSALQLGNCCFIDPETFEPYADQLEFLSQIRSVPVAHLDHIFKSLQSTPNSKVHASTQSNAKGLASTQPILKKSASTHQIDSGFRIILDRNLSISREGLIPEFADFLKNELNFASSEYLIKQQLGKNPWPSRPYFNLIEEEEDFLIVPKGMTGRVIRFCRKHNIKHDFIDNRKRLDRIHFDFHAKLRPHQKPVLDAVKSKDMGIITAPPGSGKTVIGLQIIRDKQQPALIIVHRKQLLEQWMERIESFLGIPEQEIGVIGAGKKKTSEKISVAMIQSLSRLMEGEDSVKLQNAFGTIIVDECHRLPALTFRNTITRLNSYYLYGLTATPFRKYNDGKLIFIHLGEFISEMAPLERQNVPQLKVIIRKTNFDVPYNPRTDRFETLSKLLVHDSVRNEQIINDILKEIDEKNRVIILTERRDHVEILHHFLKHSCEVIALSGDHSNRAKEVAWNRLKQGQFEVFITTGQYFGEGMDLDNVSSMFLVYPFSFNGKLIQYIGRVMRGEQIPVIYDYHDEHIPYLNQLFLKRNAWYKKLNRQTGLFDEDNEPKVLEAKGIRKIDKIVFVPMEELQFQYGSVAFRYQESENTDSMEFVIENDDIRPEFDLLKPYFIKRLQRDKIKIRIQAEIKDGQMISCDASSEDLDRINANLVDRVKLLYIRKNIIGNIPSGNWTTRHTAVNQVGEGLTEMYDSAGELLMDILKVKKVKHRRQLQYLARNHEETILKVKYITRPFAFLFLIAGREKYHLVMETLDTEEATYIWSVNKTPESLEEELLLIEGYLQMMRNEGRDAFLKTAPDNFHRVMHDYSDEQKGFVIWKDKFEDRLM